MKTSSRTYTMRARAEAVEATRDRIARVALAKFLAHHYDDVTIASVAADAGVSHQTVLNHFDSKEGLFLAATDLFSADIAETHERRRPGDPRSAVSLLVERYEETGDGNARLASVEDRIEAVKVALDSGRANHLAWLEDVFGDRLPSAEAERRRALHALYAATDVFSWKLLRRDLGLSRRATQQVITDMVEALVASWPHPEEG
jgi:AcrR family transcriptional regulator